MFCSPRKLLPYPFDRKVVLGVHDLMPEVYCSKFKTSIRHPGIWPIWLQEWVSHRFASACVYATERFHHGAIARRAVRERNSIACMNAADTTLFIGRLTGRELTAKAPPEQQSA